MGVTPCLLSLPFSSLLSSPSVAHLPFAVASCRHPLARPRAVGIVLQLGSLNRLKLDVVGLVLFLCFQKCILYRRIMPLVGLPGNSTSPWAFPDNFNRPSGKDSSSSL